MSGDENDDFIVPKFMLMDMIVESYKVENFQVIATSNPSQPFEREIIYYHGGAYARGIKPHHFYLIKSLAKSLNARVTMLDYPLAPKHKADETLEVCYKLYKQISQEADERQLVLMGDSAGGGLALAIAMMVRNHNVDSMNHQANHSEKQPIRMPDKIVLYSPWLDIGITHEEVDLYQERDAILNKEALIEIAKAYAGGMNLNDFRVSPIFGDLSQLGEIGVFYGTHELFYPRCRDFCRMDQIDGTIITGFEYEAMPHVWIIIPMEERDKALNETVNYIIGKDSHDGNS